ncbi:MAG: ROK family transcriptional regulator [Alphaproteobacteria bacterium]|nr:MAG: ROK family transcriptional regulator [Alphaproteobacteria bacterium]
MDVTLGAAGEARRVMRGTNQSGMRAYNERLVLTLLRRHGALSKTEISRQTGLSAQAISVIMRGLEAEGYLLKNPPVRGRVGQPSVPMRLNPDAAYFLGLLIGRRTFEMTLTDFLGQELGQLRQAHRLPDPDAAVAFAVAGADRLLQGLGAQGRERVSGLGIAMPYRIWEWGSVPGAAATEMQVWRHRDIAAELDGRWPFPVFVENDATAACGAELVFGSARIEGDLLHFYIGYFAGGGVALNGRLFSGATGNAGALGSMPVDRRDGRAVQLIDRASLAVLEQAVEARGGDGEAMWQRPDNWSLPEDIVADWIAGAAGALARAIVAACAVIDFRTVLIDGWMPVALRARLVTATRSALEREGLPGIELPQLRSGSIGPGAGARGAASLPLSRRFLVDLPSGG